MIKMFKLFHSFVICFVLKYIQASPSCPLLDGWPDSSKPISFCSSYDKTFCIGIDSQGKHASSTDILGTKLQLINTSVAGENETKWRIICNESIQQYVICLDDNPSVCIARPNSWQHRSMFYVEDINDGDTLFVDVELENENKILHIDFKSGPKCVTISKCLDPANCASGILEDVTDFQDSLYLLEWECVENHMSQQWIGREIQFQAPTTSETPGIQPSPSPTSKTGRIPCQGVAGFPESSFMLCNKVDNNLCIGIKTLHAPRLSRDIDTNLQLVDVTEIFTSKMAVEWIAVCDEGKELYNICLSKKPQLCIGEPYGWMFALLFTAVDANVYPSGSFAPVEVDSHRLIKRTPTELCLGVSHCKGSLLCRTTLVNIDELEDGLYITESPCNRFHGAQQWITREP